MNVFISETSSRRHSASSDSRHLHWGSKLLQRRKARRASNNLAIGPSGAIVFKGHQSLDSLVSVTTVAAGKRSGSPAAAATY